jgi:hypothetical protein
MPLILVALIAYSPTAMAKFWDAVGACFTAPCNCGLSDKYRNGYHNCSLERRVKKNYICPPCNKDRGRHE